VGLREYKQSNLYSDFLQEGNRIMGVVFNDKFISRARVVSQSDYARCQEVFTTIRSAFEITRVCICRRDYKNVEIIATRQRASFILRITNFFNVTFRTVRFIKVRYI